MNEELKQLFEGMELSEDFKSKFVEVFENAVEDKTAEVKEQAETAAEEKYNAIAEEYSEYVVSEMEDKTEQYIQEEILPMVERYVDYASEEFIKENKMVIESSTKVELADKFLQGFASIAEQYNVEVPKGQDDVVADLKGKLEEAQTRVDTLLRDKVELEESIVEGKRQSMIEEACEGMTETRKERFAEAAGRVKYHDQTQFSEALEELKESYQPSAEGNSITETTEELNEDQKGATTPSTDSWLDQVMGRV